MEWGLLGPETLARQRRVRTLGLGAAVRRFNDLAVPGMGGVWFGKQLLLASLGVALAEHARKAGRQVQNIDVANAVEAAACWLAFNRTRWQSDARLRGRLKLQNRTDLSFRKLSQRGFYVTQPMRMRTAQPLLALGLVEAASERFNAFGCTDLGRSFVEAACRDYRPRNRSVLNNLYSWMQGEEDCIKTEPSHKALSPLEPLPKEARELLRDCIIAGSGRDSGRRKRSLEWMEDLRNRPQQQISWDQQPPALDDEHWRDLRAGARFFLVRDASLALLDQVEAYMGHMSKPALPLVDSVPERIEQAIRTLRDHAHEYLAEDYDPSPDGMANRFCSECSAPEAVRVLEQLVSRDGRVLQLRGSSIVPGPAFVGADNQSTDDDERFENEDGESSGLSTSLAWPEGISPRIRNLFLLNADLSGRLDGWLGDADLAESN